MHKQDVITKSIPMPNVLSREVIRTFDNIRSNYYNELNQLRDKYLKQMMECVDSVDKH